MPVVMFSDMVVCLSVCGVVPNVLVYTMRILQMFSASLVLYIILFTSVCCSHCVLVLFHYQLRSLFCTTLENFVGLLFQ